MRMVCLVLSALAIAPDALAQVAAGNWVMREQPQISMTVEPRGPGFDITYHLVGGDGKPATMTLRTALDGSEAPFLVNGKPTGQTYAGKRVDARHTTGVVKNGATTTSSKAELSADGKTITVENEGISPPVAKRIEHWDKR